MKKRVKVIEKEFQSHRCSRSLKNTTEDSSRNPQKHPHFRSPPTPGPKFPGPSRLQSRTHWASELTLFPPCLPPLLSTLSLALHNKDPD